MLSRHGGEESRPADVLIMSFFVAEFILSPLRLRSGQACRRANAVFYR